MPHKIRKTAKVKLMYKIAGILSHCTRKPNKCSENVPCCLVCSEVWKCYQNKDNSRYVGECGYCICQRAFGMRNGSG